MFVFTAAALAWAADALDRPPAAVGTARSCEIAVEVDGVLRCDEELSELGDERELVLNEGWADVPEIC